MMNETNCYSQEDLAVQLEMIVRDPGKRTIVVVPVEFGFKHTWDNGTHSTREVLVVTKFTIYWV